MKHIKDINNFGIIKESVDIYDFGRKNGNLDNYYEEASKQTKEFPSDVVKELVNRLPNFSILPQYDKVDIQHYLYVELNGWSKNNWIIQYYGDYCYGIFRWDMGDGYHNIDLDWVEFCDDLEPVIQRLKRDEKKING